MNKKQSTITDLRYGLVAYTAGGGLHVGSGAKRTFPNAITVDPVRGEGVDLLMELDKQGLPIFATGCYDFVVVGDVLQRVSSPRRLLAECWRVLAEGGNLCLVRPTPIAYEWLLEDAADYCVMANLQWGAQRVDVVQKLPAGSGRHAVPEIPDGQKTVAIARPGGYGDALWASSLLPALKDEGYHTTVCVWEQGEQVLRHDPHVDRLIVSDDLRLPGQDIVAWWSHEMGRYDRFINLAESVEKNMIAVINDLRFHWPDEERRRIFGGNYLEAVHKLAGVRRRYAQRFYATPEEITTAATRQEPGRRTAVIAASGSTPPKFWPYLDELADGLIERGHAVWIFGDMRGKHMRPRQWLKVTGTSWSIRETLAFAQLADLVVGQETGILNAVALEMMRKVVLLSHSTKKNLTEHWKNTISLHGDVPCWPCHRIHYFEQKWKYCNQDPETKLAKCQSTISADAVLAAVDRAIVVRAVA